MPDTGRFRSYVSRRMSSLIAEQKVKVSDFLASELWSMCVCQSPVGTGRV